ncbi:23S rRNA (uracil(1939)-C(5))-methyltransferase RlmD [Microbulbifer yueqingensis]|uniref:23S rRNA (uracil(1939)-C(5))-methyltransferase RlmD n=1 Tax=Microbulbifer yueqingensis TaxID=658219 RepID=A0A1G8XUU5_9GAMM|nr:23S rRNA (uracil(1939)-C(5))-methyltransferase RlmD [Microbulbifer yueqingensis]SDJ93550.1 23S rRNA m(5)U-1939 methyltransferase [Microbulbifer yueqingensis]
MKKRRQRLPAGTPTVEIERLSHEVRGIGQVKGKTVFVDNALPGETVRIAYTASRSKFAEGVAREILHASPDRCLPRCRHFDTCGGCALQYMEPAAQIAAKQDILCDQLRRFAGIEVPEILPPLAAAPYGYRRKARLGIRASRSRGVVLGFREKRSNNLTPISECPIMPESFAAKIPALANLIRECEGRAGFAHLEVAIGEDATGLVLRHLQPLSEKDLALWLAFAQANSFHLYLQPGGADSAHRVWPDGQRERLHYQLPEFSLELGFHPLDFIQVNFAINRQMVSRAVELLDIRPGERVLDLFCGLGNFTLPLARRAAQVVGVEGAPELLARARENAVRNGVDNVQFHAADLTADITSRPWAKAGFDKILIDPPRTGAIEVIRELARFGAEKVVYVSCNPATLARDTAELEKLGYRLARAGVMDMFPQTTHVESIALFERAT